MVAVDASVALLLGSGLVLVVSVLLMGTTLPSFGWRRRPSSRRSRRANHTAIAPEVIEASHRRIVTGPPPTLPHDRHARGRALPSTSRDVTSNARPARRRDRFSDDPTRPPPTPDEVTIHEWIETDPISAAAALTSLIRSDDEPAKLPEPEPEPAELPDAS